MSEAYLQLLEAAIQQLEDLKAAGARWVCLEPGRLDQLSAPIVARVAQAPRSAANSPAPVPQSSAPLPKAAPASVTIPAAVVERETFVAAAANPSQLTAISPLVSGGKIEAMAQLRARTLACQKCLHLAGSRKNVVFGVGDVHAALMFVGEAPGADEDMLGEPFVGAAGQLLTRVIKAMGFSRETVYIANVLKCRPDTPGQSSGNRKPTPEEMRTCLPYLLEQIKLIGPKVIVALGATAMEGLFGRAIPITKVRGTWQAVDQIPVMPTFHPSYLLRNQAPAVKRQVWEDMLLVLEKLGVAITEKQRNYFK